MSEYTKVYAAAREAANTASRQVLRQRTIEMGAYNARTRPIIESERAQAAEQAYNNSLRAAGFTECANANDGCDTLKPSEYKWCFECYRVIYMNSQSSSNASVQS